MEFKDKAIDNEYREMLEEEQRLEEHLEEVQVRIAFFVRTYDLV